MDCGLAARIAMSIISTAAEVPAAMMSDTTAPASIGNAASSVCTRPPENSNRDARRDRDGPFGADEEAEQIRSGRISERDAEVHDLAIGHHRLDFEHVMHGEPILQAVGAAGVLGHVPANRADLLAGVIRCVVKAERRHLARDFEIGDAWLDSHALVRDIDVEDTIETRQRDDDAARYRQRAAGEPRAVSAGHERHAVTRAQPDDALYL